LSRPGPNGKCAVCQHLERSRVELLLASGASKRAVGKKFKLHPDAIWRHWRRHVPEDRKRTLVMGPVATAALAARVAEENTSVLDHFKTVRAGLYEMYDAALQAGDRNGGALLAGRLHENLNSVARLTGELAHSPMVMQQTNIFVSPQFAELQAVLIRVLAQYPEARSRVIQEFRALETRHEAPKLIEQHDGSVAA
jgi:hypothetical protein